jgi:hypothetical protein
LQPLAALAGPAAATSGSPLGLLCCQRRRLASADRRLSRLGAACPQPFPLPLPLPLPVPLPQQDDAAQNFRWTQPKRPRTGDARHQQQQQPGGPGGAGGAHAGATAWGVAGVVKDNALTVFVKGLSHAATLADVEGLFCKAGKARPPRFGIGCPGAAGLGSRL